MLLLVITGVLPFFSLIGAQSPDYTQYVRPFFGAEGRGHVFPGVAAAPFSVVKLGPDLYTGRNNYAGYAATGNVTGFSLMHETGIGGSPKYGTVAQFPVVGAIPNPLLDLSVPRSSPDEAEVGFYQTSLDSGVRVQLAGSRHAGFFSYTFPSDEASNILIDVSHILENFRRDGWDQGYAGGDITIAEDNHYEGSGIYNGGWNLSPDWTVYFCGYFNTTPSSVLTFAGHGTKLDYYGTDIHQKGSSRLGAVYNFTESTVSSRVGISFISTSRACEYVNEEIPEDSEIESLVDSAKDTWNTLALSKVTTTSSADISDLQLIYSSIYAMHLIPSNRTGDMPGWGATESYYDDFYTLWDLYRCSTPLLHIFSPTAYTEIVQGLINIYQHTGWMPGGRSSNFNGRSQGGSNSDNVLADAYVKGVKVNWDDGYAAMKKNAEVKPPNNHDPISPDSPDKQGRGALSDWLDLGWISPAFNRAVSRAVEYSGNDFALHQVALGLGNRDAETNKYLRRSQNWRNHYNPEQTSLNYSGFLVPRNADGSFELQDPLSCGGCYWGDAYYEATPWEYLFSPIHDMAHLIDLTGGPEAFGDKLETMFAPDRSPENRRFNHTIINPGNEPSFSTPYLFNFIGRQDLSVKHSRYIAETYYSMEPNGLPGNSDAGAMQAWLLWTFIGLYPLTGQDVFLIVSPRLSDLTINLGDGRDVDGDTPPSSSPSLAQLHITTTGDGDYVQSLRVNSQDWNQSWVTWDDVFARGGEMEFVLGPEPSQWAADGDPPPSPASVLNGANGTPQLNPLLLGFIILGYCLLHLDSSLLM